MTGVFLLTAFLAAYLGLQEAWTVSGAGSLLPSVLAPLVGGLIGLLLSPRPRRDPTLRPPDRVNPPGLILLGAGGLGALLPVKPAAGMLEALPDPRPWLAFMALLGTALGVRALRRGASPVGVWGVWTLLTAGPWSTVGLERSPVAVPILILGGLWSLLGALDRCRPGGFRRALPLLAFGLVMTAGCLASPDPGPSLQVAAPMAPALLIGVALILEGPSHSSIRSVQVAAILLAGGLAGQACLKWSQLVVTHGERTARGLKLWIAGNHPNALASLMLLLIPLLVAVRITESRAAIRRVATWLVPITCVWLVGTQSRGAWIAFLLAVVTAVLSIRRIGTLRLSRFEAAVSGLVLVLALVALLCAGAYAARLLEPESGLRRLRLWELAGCALWDRPALGIGPGDTSRILEWADPRDAKGADWLRMWAGWDRLGRHSHSLYVQSLLDGGPLALLALLWMLGTVMRRGWRASRGEDPGGVAAWSALGVMAFALHGLLDMTLRYPMVAALAGTAVALVLGGEPRPYDRPFRAPWPARGLLLLGVILALGSTYLQSRQGKILRLESQGLSTKAAESARRLSVLDPLEPELIRIQARAARGSGWFLPGVGPREMAVRLQERVVRRSGRNPEDLLTWVGDLVTAGRLSEAAVRARQSLRHDPAGLRTHARAAVAAAALGYVTGDVQRGRDALLTALLVDPETPYGMVWTGEERFDPLASLQAVLGDRVLSGIPPGGSFSTPRLPRLLEILEERHLGPHAPQPLPEDRLRITLARGHWTLGHYHRALELLAEGGLRPEDLDAWRRREVRIRPEGLLRELKREAEQHLEQEQYQRALECLLELRGWGISDPWLGEWMARTWSGLGLQERALYELEALEARAPSLAGIQNGLGVIHYRMGDLDLAERRFHAALALDPEDQEALYNLARIRLELEDPEAAVSMLREVLQHDAHHSQARYNLARALEQMGRLEEAREEYRRYLSGSSEDEPELVRHARKVVSGE